MASTTVVWTALPAGAGDGQPGSPCSCRRASTPGDPAVLASFPPLADWPAVVGGAEYAVRLADGTTFEASRVDPPDGLDSPLWAALFRRSCASGRTRQSTGPATPSSPIPCRRCRRSCTRRTAGSASSAVLRPVAADPPGALRKRRGQAGGGYLDLLSDPQAERAAREDMRQHPPRPVRPAAAAARFWAFHHQPLRRAPSSNLNGADAPDFADYVDVHQAIAALQSYPALLRAVGLVVDLDVPGRRGAARRGTVAVDVTAPRRAGLGGEDDRVRTQRRPRSQPHPTRPPSAPPGARRRRVRRARPRGVRVRARRRRRRGLQRGTAADVAARRHRGRRPARRGGAARAALRGHLAGARRAPRADALFERAKALEAGLAGAGTRSSSRTSSAASGSMSGTTAPEPGTVCWAGTAPTSADAPDGGQLISPFRRRGSDRAGRHDDGGEAGRGAAPRRRPVPARGDRPVGRLEPGGAAPGPARQPQCRPAPCPRGRRHRRPGADGGPADDVVPARARTGADGSVPDDDAGSLPQLRFGRRYRLRLRAVDLAGNILPVTDPGDAHACRLYGAAPYLRYEPSPPRPSCCATTCPGVHGETLHRVVLRSANTDPSLDGAVAAPPVERHLAPPRTSVQGAELHGALDDQATAGCAATRRCSPRSRPGTVLSCRATTPRWRRRTSSYRRGCRTRRARRRPPRPSRRPPRHRIRRRGDRAPGPGAVPAILRGAGRRTAVPRRARRPGALRPGSLARGTGVPARVRRPGRAGSPQRPACRCPPGTRRPAR